MATRVTITKALEERLRDYATREKDNALVEEIVKLLDAENVKRAAIQGSETGKPGLGYQELVALLRSYLGAELIVPPKPSVAFISRLVVRARDLGLNYGTAEQIVRGLRATGRGPYRLADIIYGADIHYNRGRHGQGDDNNNGEQQLGGVGQGNVSRVFTGRPVEE